MNEQQFHKNVKITYPNDKNEPIVVEYYTISKRLYCISSFYEI